MQTSPQLRAYATAALTAGLLVFLVLVAPIVLSETFVPGDNVDNRFNLYILEHTYRWLQSPTTRSLVSPPVFHPLSLTLFFSDTHLGSSIFYVVPRLLGLSEWQAFTAWCFIGYYLTFLSAFYVLAKLGFPPIPAAIGATIFAFPLPSISSFGHAQLFWRAGIPLTLFHAAEALRRHEPRSVAWALVWLSAQTLMNIYLGVFTALLAVAFTVSYPSLVRRPVSAPGSLRLAHASAAMNQSLLELLQRQPALLALAACAAIAAVALLGSHAYVSAIYGISRPWWEILSMLPRPSNFFMMDKLPYWLPISRQLGSDVVRHEHQLFFGLAATTLAAVGAWAVLGRGRWTTTSPVIKAFLLAGAVLAVVATAIFDLSAWSFLYMLPGLHAIRAVGRIILVLAFPFAILAAVGATFLIAPGTAAHARRIALAALSCFGLFELYSIEKRTIDPRAVEQRLAKIVSEATAAAHGVESPVLHVLYPEQWHAASVEVDAMMAAGRLGWPTLNGYSGWLPNGFASSHCPHQLYEVRRHDPHATSSNVASKVNSIVSLGPAGICQTRAAERDGKEPRSWRPALPQMAAHIHLDDIGLERREQTVIAHVAVRNFGTETLFAGPAPNNPRALVNISWRFVPQGPTVSASGPEPWPQRTALPFDVPPSGGETRLTFLLNAPAQPGTYDLQMSMVSEHAFWFHDHGFKVLRFRDAISVP